MEYTKYIETLEKWENLKFDLGFPDDEVEGQTGGGVYFRLCGRDKGGFSDSISDHRLFSLCFRVFSTLSSGFCGR